MRLTTITDPRNFYFGRRVRVLERSDWGLIAGRQVVVCKVEIAEHPGLTTQVREEHLGKPA